MYKEVCLCVLTTRRRVIIFKIKWMIKSWKFFFDCFCLVWMLILTAQGRRGMMMLTNIAGIHAVLCCQLLNSRHKTFYIICQQKKDLQGFAVKDNQFLRIFYIVILYQMYTPLSLPEVYIPLFILWKHSIVSFYPFFCCGLFPHSIFIKM